MTAATCRWCGAGRYLSGRCERCGEAERDPTMTQRTAMPCPIRELPEGESRRSVLAGMSGLRALSEIGRSDPFRLISCRREHVRVHHFSDGIRSYFVGAATQEEAHLLAEFGHDRVCRRRSGEVVPFPRMDGIPESIEFADFGGLADELRGDQEGERALRSVLDAKRQETLRPMRERGDRRAGAREWSESWPNGELGWIDLGDLIREDLWLPQRYRAMVSA